MAAGIRSSLYAAQCQHLYFLAPSASQHVCVLMVDAQAQARRRVCIATRAKTLYVTNHFHASCCGHVPLRSGENVAVDCCVILPAAKGSSSARKDVMFGFHARLRKSKGNLDTSDAAVPYRLSAAYHRYVRSKASSTLRLA
eukprot:352306-Pleurochrysis_carterae.AAC.3